MRMRLSAAYKGVNALLMKAGAQDFMTGQEFNHATFFGEGVDIHHIFPKKWCISNGIQASTYDSIINKSPLSYKTNIRLGGDAPSVYLSKLEAAAANRPAFSSADLDRLLQSHLIDPDLLRTDDFAGFMEARQSALLDLIERATGQKAWQGETTADDLEDEHESESEMTSVAA